MKKIFKFRFDDLVATQRIEIDKAEAKSILGEITV